MIQLLGVLFVTSACGFLGFAYAKEKKKDLLAVEGFSAFFDYLLLRLPSLALIEDIISELESPELDALGVTEKLKFGVGACNKRYAAAIELFEGDVELYPILKQAGKELGCSDYRVQETSLRSARDRLVPLCERRRASYAAGERCYRALGVLIGAALSILML